MALTNAQLVRLISGYGTIVENVAVAVEVSHEKDRPTLPRCLALLENESAGENIYGREGALPALWGTHVTEANYREYETARSRGEGNNGVGPCQLTSTGYQVEADNLGGCWVPKHNMQVGFSILHQLILRRGVWGGFESYNGSGPPAEAYANRAVGRAEAWEQRLRNAGHLS